MRFAGYAIVLLCLKPTLCHTGKKKISNPYDASRQKPECLQFSNEVDGQNFNDPYWPCQWFMGPNDISTNESSYLGHNITGAWKLGYTGKGTVVGILDDAIGWNNEELRNNFNVNISKDYICHSLGNHSCVFANVSDVDDYPTKIAGIVAAKANNFGCGVGVSHDAQIASIDVFEGNNFMDLLRSGLLHAGRIVDIYLITCYDPYYIWDFWTRVDLRNALIYGVETGRNGKGSVYVLPVFRKNQDNHSYIEHSLLHDIHTIPIASVEFDSTVSRTRFAAIFAVALTSSVSGPDIFTTSEDGSCIDAPIDASTSSAIAAGIISLALEANPNLTWRDVMHLIVESAETSHLNASESKTNAAGIAFSYEWGFGLLNAGKMVDLARKWTLVPKMVKRMVQVRDKDVRESTEEWHINFDNATGLVVEQVILQLNAVCYSLQHLIEIDIISPSGTVSTILQNSDFMLLDMIQLRSLHFWKEPANGTWTVKFLKKSNDSCHFSFIWFELYGYVQENASLPIDQLPSHDIETPDISLTHVAETKKGNFGLHILQFPPTHRKTTEASSTKGVVSRSISNASVSVCSSDRCAVDSMHIRFSVGWTVGWAILAIINLLSMS